MKIAIVLLSLVLSIVAIKSVETPTEPDVLSIHDGERPPPYIVSEEFVQQVKYQIVSNVPTPAPTAIPTPEPTPTPAPKLEPPSPPVVTAASVTSGIPWYVPPEWHDAYLQCLSAPYRHDVSEYVWRFSKEGGYENGWRYNEALFVYGKEGGDDFCQFNTQGSGACGPFQLLTCPPDGLTPEGQMRGAMNKYQDGYNRNPNDPWRAHWFNFWTN